MISHPPPHQTLCVMSYVVRSHDLVFKMEPEALVGRQVRVHWRDDDAWFMGSVIGYDPETGRHKVRVVNGQRHWLQPRNRTAHKVCVVYGQRHWLRRRNRTAQGARGLWAASLTTTQKQDGTRCAWLMGSVIGYDPETGWHTRCAWFLGSVIGCDAETGRHKVRVVNGQRHWLQPRNRTAHKVRG